MKNLMLYIMSLGFLMLFTLNSCRKITGVGPIVTEERELSGFSSIKSTTGAQIFVSQSNQFKVEIEAQQNIIDLIETEVVNNQLLIKKENHGIIADWQSVKVYISLPEIQGLTLAGSGNLTANTAISSPQLELKISGSGGLYLPKLETNEVTATISGSGDLQIDEGYADKEILQITGSGNLHLLNLESRLSEIKITASGNADVWVTENLSVRITGSGNVRYKGNPLVDTDITGSGSVQPY